MVSNNGSSVATENGCNENSKMNEKKDSNLRNIRNYNGKEYNLSSNNIKYNILPSLQNEDDSTVTMVLAEDINDCKAYNQSSCDKECCNNQNEDEPACGRLCRARQKRKAAQEAKKKECACDYCERLNSDANNCNRKRKRSGNDESCGKKGGSCGCGCTGNRGTSNRSNSCCEPKCKCKKCCPPRCCESCESCCSAKCCDSCESCCPPKCCKSCCPPKSCKSCCPPKSCKSCCPPKNCKSCCPPKCCKSCCEPKKCCEEKCCERNNCASSPKNVARLGDSESTCCKTPGCNVHDPNRKPLLEENSQDSLRQAAGKISKRKKMDRADRLR